MERRTAWIAGRGVARACGFAWQVPEALYWALARGRLARKRFESTVRARLAAAQAQARIDTRPLDCLLDVLQRRGAPGWRHVFATTNWNTVLEQALERRGHRVWHLNGSIGEPGQPLSTEIDTTHRATLHADEGFRRLRAAEVRVLAGLSLASELDRGVLQLLRARQPRRTGWIVVNDEPADLRRAAALLGEGVVAVQARFEEWVDAGMPELARLGVLQAQAR